MNRTKASATTSTRNQTADFPSASRLAQSEIIDLYVDGRGANGVGCGSGYGWIEPTTNKQDVQFQDGLSNNKAEYLAILLALESAPKNGKLRIHTDSTLAYQQLMGVWQINDPELRQLADRIKELFEKKQFVFFKMNLISGKENPADKLLRNGKRAFLQTFLSEK